MIFRVNIKYSLISEPPNLPVAKAMDVRRIVCGVGGLFSRRGAERQRAQSCRIIAFAIGRWGV